MLASDFEDGIEIGSLVQVTSSQDPLYGVVRWLGKPSGSQVLVGIELVSLTAACWSLIQNKTFYISRKRKLKKELRALSLVTDTSLVRQGKVSLYRTETAS